MAKYTLDEIDLADENPVPRATAADTAAARKVLSVLQNCEVDGTLSPVARRALRDEADTLAAAIANNRHDHPKHHGDRDALVAAANEARRVARMWGVTV